MLEDPEGLPVSIARSEPTSSKFLGLVRRDLVVGDEDRLPTSTVLLVQARDGVGGGARTGEKVENHCVGLGLNKEPDRIFDSEQ